MFKVDSNWRRYWHCHMVHFLQGGFTAALLADGWLVAACLTFAFYVLYQCLGWVVKRDTVLRDLKVYGTAFWLGLAVVYVSEWSLVAFLNGLW